MFHQSSTFLFFIFYLSLLLSFHFYFLGYVSRNMFFVFINKLLYSITILQHYYNYIFLFSVFLSFYSLWYSSVKNFFLFFIIFYTLFALSSLFIIYFHYYHHQHWRLISFCIVKSFFFLFHIYIIYDTAEFYQLSKE